MNEEDRYRGCLLGLACGDAVGTAVEFRPRGTADPVTDMTGGGPFQLKPGEWTDDTSMALCLATSLVEKGGFDPVDQMTRYCKWQDHGYLSSNGRCFDIGVTVSGALSVFERTGEPFCGSEDPTSAGNGCLMRLAPVPMFYAADIEAAAFYSGESARTTHGARECVDACRLFGSMLAKALGGLGKDAVLFENGFPASGRDALCDSVRDIAGGAYREKAREDIHGTGYVVKSLEAALWCFMQTCDYRDAILTATNLGDDADTTAAICGQIAGAYYGIDRIPESWRERLVMRDDIVQLADQLRPRR